MDSVLESDLTNRFTSTASFSIAMSRTAPRWPSTSVETAKFSYTAKSSSSLTLEPHWTTASDRKSFWLTVFWRRCENHDSVTDTADNRWQWAECAELLTHQTIWTWEWYQNHNSMSTVGAKNHWATRGSVKLPEISIRGCKTCILGYNRAYIMTFHILKHSVIKFNIFKVKKHSPLCIIAQFAQADLCIPLRYTHIQTLSLAAY